MQNIGRLYQNYRQICVTNISIIKNGTAICSLFSECHKHRDKHVMLLTTGTTDDNLQKSIEGDLKSGKTARIFEKLQTADDSSLLRLPKRTWGSVFYILNQNKEFKMLDKMRAKTKDLKLNCGEGALTTLIKSYVARCQPEDAVNVLIEMKNNGILRHSRTYFPVITSLAENGIRNKAFELFEEMQRHTFKSNKNISLSIPSKMTAALIRSCIQTEISEYNKAKDVLLWYNHSGRLLTLEILDAIKEWLDNDPVNIWTMAECKISEDGLCNNCGTYLNSGLLTSHERDKLKMDILNAIEAALNFDEKAGERTKFHKYVTFLQQCSPCDVIIDGMSIGLSSNVEKQKKKFNVDALLKVMDHFKQQGKKTLIFLNTSVSPTFLSNKHAQYFVSSVGDDDLYIMYASALWNMAPFLVTRDKFREHRFLLAFQSHAAYLKWMRSHTIKVQGDMLMFHWQKYDAVVQRGSSCWHFPLVDGSWFCAKK